MTRFRAELGALLLGMYLLVYTGLARLDPSRYPARHRVAGDLRATRRGTKALIDARYQLSRDRRVYAELASDPELVGIAVIGKLSDDALSRRRYRSLNFRQLAADAIRAARDRL